jgi:DNA polymerase III delta subunit
MVNKATPLYLFIGQDSLAKDSKLKQLKQELLAKETEQFNVDTLYARELKLAELQEKILCLPVNAKKRLLVIKGAENLKKELKDFILRYSQRPPSQIVLVLDMDYPEARDEFIGDIVRRAQVYRFREAARLDTFSLSRQIELGKPAYALRVLNQLLENGERPERILGGLRYAWQRSSRGGVLAAKKGLKLLLNCDLDIKTGRLKPNFALEKLVLCLCGMQKSFR